MYGETIDFSKMKNIVTVKKCDQNLKSNMCLYKISTVDIFHFNDDDKLVILNVTEDNDIY